MARRLPKVLTGEEKAAVLALLNTRYPTPHRNLCMIRLMLEAGLRVGEVVALKPEHLDMASCRLMVREGKGARDRVLWFRDDLRDLIGAWFERRPESEWLFPTRDGGRVQTRYLRALVKRLALKARVAEARKVSPHSLRHTFATDLLRKTKNIRLVQKTLGHASLSTTMIYTHIYDGDVEEAMRGLSEEQTAG